MIAGMMAAMALLAEASSEVAKLDWMAGSWIEARGGVTTREVWLAPIDGVMAGASQVNRPGKPAFVEHGKISPEPAGVTYTALTPGQPPTAFLLKPTRDGEAVFENLAHDYPQRVIYRRYDADLCARIEGMRNGKLQTQQWRYRRLD